MNHAGIPGQPTSRGKTNRISAPLNQLIAAPLPIESPTPSETQSLVVLPERLSRSSIEKKFRGGRGKGVCHRHAAPDRPNLRVDAAGATPKPQCRSILQFKSVMVNDRQKSAKGINLASCR